MNIIWQRLMNMAFFSQRSSGCCNLRCSICCIDQDATYTSLTGRGRYGINLVLSLSLRLCVFLSASLYLLFLKKYLSSRKVKLLQMSFSVSVKTRLPLILPLKQKVVVYFTKSNREKVGGRGYKSTKTI